MNSLFLAMRVKQALLNLKAQNRLHRVKVLDLTTFLRKILLRMRSWQNYIFFEAH